MKGALKTLATLGGLTVLAPIDLLAAIIGRLTSKRPAKAPASYSKTVLLTGGKMSKSLQLARAFHAAGHRVILSETEKYWCCGHQYSPAVDKFYTTPSPAIDREGYIRGLRDIAEKEAVDILIPVASPAAAHFDSLGKTVISEVCELFHFDAETTDVLDDKYQFCKRAASYGLSAPDVHLITDPQQVIDFDFAASDRRYILKSIPYDSVWRLDLTRYPCEDMEERVRALPISEAKPWVMQEFIPGKEFCTHSTVRDGRIRVYGCSESSAFQVNYKHIENPAIYQWVETYVREANLTGQISFDFIEAADGTIYPIECNPRTHTAITMFHDHPDLAEGYLGETEIPVVTPLPESAPTYWLYHELWRGLKLRSRKDFTAWWQRLREGIDGVYRPWDPWPYFMLHHWQIPVLLVGSLINNKPWVKIDFNIGKLVETGGD